MKLYLFWLVLVLAAQTMIMEVVDIPFWASTALTALTAAGMAFASVIGQHSQFWRK